VYRTAAVEKKVGEITGQTWGREFSEYGNDRHGALFSREGRGRACCGGGGETVQIYSSGTFPPPPSHHHHTTTTTTTISWRTCLIGATCSSPVTLQGTWRGWGCEYLKARLFAGESVQGAYRDALQLSLLFGSSAPEMHRRCVVERELDCLSSS
jgi:hypothetical protein